MHIRISIGTKFPLKLTILNFWTKFTKDGYFKSKTEKVNITTEFSIFELVYVLNFCLNWQFDLLDQICPERGFLKQKNRIFACAYGLDLLY